MARLCAGVVALFAGKRFLTTVGENVPPQVTGLGKCVVAPFASIGFLTSVYEHMLIQATSGCAFVTALVTDEGPL